MNNYMKKPKPVMDRRVEIEVAQLFGKHVSKTKAIVLLILTVAACLMPLILGIRLWELLPDQIGGEGDPMPRWMGIPGVQIFFLLTNLLVHGQLWYHQKKLTIPSNAVRVVGRWGCPILSIALSGMLLWSGAGIVAPEAFAGLCCLSIFLFLAGSYLWGCPRNAKVALPVLKSPDGRDNWETVHARVGQLCLAGGVVALAAAMLLPV